MKRIAFFIMETITNDKGDYIPCIAIEGEGGYHKTDWQWGKNLDIALNCAKDKNNRLELTQEDIDKIILSTMF